ncbi:MAG: GNAT family N-acetyltransferase [Microbacteriaceae bacterium]
MTQLRPLTVEDLPDVVALNNHAYPAVPVTPLAEFAELAALSDVALVVEDDDGSLLGFLIALHPGSPYESENYRFFEERGTDSLYVDRIVVAESARSQGLGAVLYDAVFDAARTEGRVEVTCEVNVDPPNPRSMAFHQRLGFREVGRQPTKGGAVTVALLAASV